VTNTPDGTPDGTPNGVPGRGDFGPAVDAFDAAADALLEQLRDHPLADRLFLAASHLGDFSLIWHLASLIRGVARRRPDQAIVLAAALGLESLIVNQGVKRLFRRTRPTTSGDARLQVRQPSTSAFPSGHASAAAFAAATLIAWDGRRWAPLWISLAAIVGVSRAYVKIHHPSDVVGGAVTGLALAALARPAIKHFAGR
jgi:membrane-associated phospholipid phosphatase